MFNNEPLQSLVFMAMLGTSCGRGAWSGDNVTIRPATRRNMSKPTFGVEIPAAGVSGLFLGLSQRSDLATIFYAFKLGGGQRGQYLVSSSPCLDLLDIRLQKDNQPLLQDLIHQRYVRLYVEPSTARELKTLNQLSEDWTDQYLEAKIQNPYWSWPDDHQPPVPNTLRSERMETIKYLIRKSKQRNENRA